MSRRDESKRRRPGGGSDGAPAVTPPQLGTPEPAPSSPAPAPPPSTPLAPGLHLVATPIGNAADITLRALDVLARADALACEDTRRTRRLMEMHGIAVGGRPVVSYHDRNGAARRPRIMAWLAEGMSVAYASDAGTPLVSDPGYRLVEAARAGGHGVHAVPGPSAVLAALTVAGLPTDRFLFLGFLPPRSGARRRALAEVAGVRATLVVFEAPQRVAAALADMERELGGERDCTIARELTKRFEEVRRGTLAALAAETGDAAPPRGEIVLVVAPPEDGAQAAASEAELDEALVAALASGSLKQAVGDVAARLGLPRRRVYARALELAGRGR